MPLIIESLTTRCGRLLWLVVCTTMMLVGRSASGEMLYETWSDEGGIQTTLIVLDDQTGDLFFYDPQFSGRIPSEKINVAEHFGDNHRGKYELAVFNDFRFGVVLVYNSAAQKLVFSSANLRGRGRTNLREFQALDLKELVGEDPVWALDRLNGVSDHFLFGCYGRQTGKLICGQVWLGGGGVSSFYHATIDQQAPELAPQASLADLRLKFVEPAHDFLPREPSGPGFYRKVMMLHTHRPVFFFGMRGFRPGGGQAPYVGRLTPISISVFPPIE